MSMNIDEIITYYGQVTGNVNETRVARAELEQLRYRSAALSDLLAVIYRDGGQQERDYGTKRATLTAQRIVIELRQKVDDLHN